MNTEEMLTGPWNINTVPFTWGPDGTYEGEFDSGTYTFDGSVVTLHAGMDSATCLGTQGSYSVTFLDADTVKMDVIDDQCEVRKLSAFGELKWKRATE